MPLIKTSYSNPWYIFWALVLANVIASFDWMFTSVALPTMASDFNLPLSRAAWIPLAGTLTIGEFLLPTGSLADLFGRKRLQLFAVVLIFTGSIIAALAPSPIILISGRILSSAAVAVIHTQNMAILAAVFPDAERGKAIGYGIGVSSIGFLITPLVGGYLIDFIGWQSVYWMIAFLTIPAFIVTVIIMKESQVSPQRTGKRLNFDWVGAVLIALGISLAVITLNAGNDQGWLSLIILVMTVGSFFCIGAFVLWELNNQNPLFEFRFCIYFLHADFFHFIEFGFAKYKQTLLFIT